MGAFSAAKYIAIKNQGQESAHTCAQLEMVGRVHKLLVHNWKWSKSWEESGAMKEGVPSLPIIVFAQIRQLQPDVHCTPPTFLVIIKDHHTLV